MNPALLAAAGGGTIASYFLNSAAQDKVADARNAVTSAERARQAVFDAETAKINTGAQDRYQGFGDKQDERAAELAAFYKTPVTTPTTPNTIAALPPTHSDVVQREMDLRGGIADAYVNHQADSLGKLRSFADVLGGISRDQAADAQRIGQVGGFKQGSAKVTDLELNSANNAGNSLKFWADLSNGAAKVATVAGLSGTYAPAATTTGAATNIVPAAAKFAPATLGDLYASSPTGGVSGLY